MTLPIVNAGDQELVIRLVYCLHMLDKNVENLFCGLGGRLLQQGIFIKACKPGEKHRPMGSVLLLKAPIARDQLKSAGCRNSIF